jgi:hypothetical protein
MNGSTPYCRHVALTQPVSLVRHSVHRAKVWLKQRCPCTNMECWRLRQRSTPGAGTSALMAWCRSARVEVAVLRNCDLRL